MALADPAAAGSDDLHGYAEPDRVSICLSDRHLPALYGTFLAIQTLRHRGYFTDPAAQDENGLSEHAGHGVFVLHSVPFHALLLLTYLMLILAP